MNQFRQRKESILYKVDKSSIGSWDKKIIPLCNKLNKSNNYYSTSSCSGRIVVMVDQEKKGPGLFEFVSHDLVDFKNFWKYLPKEKAKLNLKFKCEPPILHVACKDMDSASKLLEKAKKSGLKHSGINAFGKNIILELNGSDKLEFPLTNNGKILVDENFLKLIIKQSNDKLKKGWINLQKLQKSIK